MRTTSDNNKLQISKLDKASLSKVIIFKTKCLIIEMIKTFLNNLFETSSTVLKCLKHAL
jgi:hypothetical protein